MKKILIILAVLLTFTAQSQKVGSFKQQYSGDTYFQNYSEYLVRVSLDSGIIESMPNTFKIMKGLKAIGVLDSVRFLWTGEMGAKERVSGVNHYATKLYSGDTDNNDAVQTTELNQPFLSGNIAPNEKLCLNNPTGVSNYLTFPNIIITNKSITVVQTDTTDKYKITQSTSTGTYNKILPNGKLVVYIIYDKLLTTNQKTAEYNLLRSIYPEMESVVIGSQELTTSNCDMVATPIGNVIQNMQLASNVERYTGIVYLDGGWVNNGDGSFTHTAGSIGILYDPYTATDRYYKISCTISGATGGTVGISGGGAILKYFTNNTTQTYYLKLNFSAGLYYQADATFDGTISGMSVKELGWADATDLYNGLIAQGSTVAASTKEAAMWCYYNNDPILGSIYGKLYNWYAVKLIQDDIDAYNTANPTNHWGWHVADTSEISTLTNYLSTDVGNKLKISGTDYWNNDLGTNTSGFTMLGGSNRDNNGTFSTLKSFGNIWTKIAYNSINAYSLNFTSSGSGIDVSEQLKKKGFSLRLIRD